MAREIVVLCDVCREPDAKKYTITGPDGTIDLDLCETHAQPLIELMELGHPPKKDFKQTRLTRALEARVRLG